MDKYERRRQNVMKLRDEFCEGKNKAIAEKIGRADTYVSRMLYPEGKAGKKRIGDDLVEALEVAFSLPHGWLDHDHSLTAVRMLSDISNAGEPIYKTKKGDVISIQQYETGGSMGRGIVLHDQPGIIQGWQVTPEWIQKNVRNCTSVENLAIVTGFGDSMRGMFNPGDPLLVDTGIKIADVDAVYFFRVENEGFIKRLQRIPGEGIRVISANPEYESWTIKPGMDFQVFARVIKVWKSTDF